jgi:hypothetical protein
MFCSGSLNTEHKNSFADSATFLQPRRRRASVQGATRCRSGSPSSLVMGLFITSETMQAANYLMFARANSRHAII